MIGHEGDFTDLSPKALLEELQANVTEARSAAAAHPVGDAELAKLRQWVTEDITCGTGSRRSPQEALERAGECIRGAIGAEGMMVLYTPRIDPYHSTALACCGTSSEKINVCDQFVAGQISCQGTEFCPFPALDFEQNLWESYFQRDALIDPELDAPNDLNNLLRRFGIEEWLATSLSDTPTYQLMLISFFDRAFPVRTRRAKCVFMSRAAPILRELLEWMGLCGKDSLVSLLEKTPSNLGTLIIDRDRAASTTRPIDPLFSQGITYDHQATAMVAERLAAVSSIRALDMKLEPELRDWALCSSKTDIGSASVFEDRFDAWAHVDHIRDRKIIRCLFAPNWPITPELRKQFRRKHHRPLMTPSCYSGELGGTYSVSKHHNNPENKLQEVLVRQGKVAVLGTQKNPHLFVAEPVTRQALHAALVSPTTELLPLSTLKKDLKGYEANLEPDGARLVLSDSEGYAYAVLQSVKSHPLFATLQIMALR